MVATAKISALVLTGTEDIVMNPESLVIGAAGAKRLIGYQFPKHMASAAANLARSAQACGTAARGLLSQRFHRCYQKERFLHRASSRL